MRNRRVIPRWHEWFGLGGNVGKISCRELDQIT